LNCFLAAREHARHGLPQERSIGRTALERRCVLSGVSVKGLDRAGLAGRLRFSRTERRAAGANRSDAGRNRQTKTIAVER
jgi:hypothetical protein